MKFYGREEEIAILRKERELSHRQSRFTVVTGRRRVGKTELIDKALNDGTDDYLYLLFSRKNEKSLCRELLEAVRFNLILVVAVPFVVALVCRPQWAMCC